MDITKSIGRKEPASHQLRDVDEWEMMRWVLAEDEVTEREGEVSGKKRWDLDNRNAVVGEVMDEITWRFFPPLVTVPGFAETSFQPEECESKPAVMPVRLLPRRGALTPVRVAIWSISIFLIAATAYLLWNIEPSGDTPAAMGVPGTFDTRAEDDFVDSCEDTALSEGAILKSEEESTAEKPVQKDLARLKQKIAKEEVSEKQETPEVEESPKKPVVLRLEDNPY